MRKGHSCSIRVYALAMFGAAPLLCAPLLLIPLLSGCASKIEAAFDPGEDFAGYHTWDWQTLGGPWVESSQASPSALHSELRSLIGQGLSLRGYVRGPERPDFFVRFRLSLERRTEQIAVPRAPYLLSSMNSGASYWIEGTESVLRSFDDMQLSIEVSGRSGRVVWTAATRERLDEGQSPDLDAVVKALLARFPEATPPPRPDPADQLARWPDRAARRPS